MTKEMFEELAKLIDEISEHGKKYFELDELCARCPYSDRCQKDMFYLECGQAEEE